MRTPRRPAPNSSATAELVLRTIREPSGSATSRFSLMGYVRSAGERSLVLGISDGVVSLTAGLLAQRAVLALRAMGYHADFVAVRLPYGEQADEQDARKCLQIIEPDRILTIDI